MHDPDQSQQNLVIDNTDESFEYWLNQPYVSPALKEQLKGAAILLVPEPGFREIDRPLFPVRTETLFTFFREHAGGVHVDICIANEDYAEIALHADTKRIGAFVITAIALPLFINLLSSYIYNSLRPAPKDTITFTVTIVDDSSAKKFTFDGSADDFKKVAPEIQKLWENSQ